MNTFLCILESRNKHDAGPENWGKLPITKKAWAESDLVHYVLDINLSQLTVESRGGRKNEFDIKFPTKHEFSGK